MCFSKALAADECGFTPFVIDRNLTRASYNRIARGTIGTNRGMRDDVWGQQALGGDSSPFLDDTLGILRLCNNLISWRKTSTRGYESLTTLGDKFQ